MSGDFYDGHGYGDNRSGYFQNSDFDIQIRSANPFFDKDERERGDVDMRVRMDDFYETRRDDRFRRDEKDLYSGANREDSYNVNRESRDDRDRGRDLYSRERDRDRDRGRYRDRERDRDRDDKREFDRRNRQRGSEGGYRNNDKYQDSRDRDRDRDRDREKDRERNRDRDRDRDRSRDRDRDQDRDRDRDRDRERNTADQPSTVIMLRGLPSNVIEDDIQVEIDDFGVPVKDIVLARKQKGKKSSGASRGFAFVEFQNLSDATRWMEQNQARIKLRGQWVLMNYSQPRPQRDHDWNCSKCGAYNFKRRDRCFKCSVSREESAQYIRDNYDGIEEVGTEPSTSLIVRGLDVLSTEDKICAALGAVTTVSIQNVRVARDSLTNTSRGFCYVDFATVEESTEALKTLNTLQSPIIIDNKEVTVNYVNLNQNAKPSSVVSSGSAAGATNAGMTAMAAIAAAQWSTSASQQQEIQQQVETEQQQIYDYSSYYQQYGSAANAPEYSQYYQQQQQQQQQQSQAVAAAATVAASGGKESEELSDIAAIAQQQVAAARQYQVQQQQLQQHIVANMQQQQSLASLDPQERLKMEAQQWTQQQTDTPQLIEEKQEKKGRRRKEQAAYQKPTSVEYKRQASNEAVSYSSDAKYPAPDVSTYQYDSASGYYYDSTTGLHYDANSQYFYNSQTGQYLYWDAQKSSYLPAPSTAATATPAATATITTTTPPATPAATPAPTNNTPTNLATTPTAKNTEEGGKEKEKKEKVIIAKKIAKDMERWAKSMNQAKDSSSGRKSFGSGFGEFEKSSASADAGFAVLEKKSTLSEKSVSMLEQLRRVQDRRKEEEAKKKALQQNAPTIVASYGGGSDSESEHEDELKASESIHIDWKRLACLLCKRQFPQKEVLVKHQQLSELHKQNLDVWRRTHMSQKEFEDMERREREAKYRDRAKERREKFGVPEPPEPKKRRQVVEATVNYEQPTKSGIGNDNIGNKMLQAMGWSEGTGLGRQRQGRKNPIEVNRRHAGAGLGLKGSTYGATDANSYKDQVKKLMQYRYEELCKDNDD